MKNETSVRDLFAYIIYLFQGTWVGIRSAATATCVGYRTICIKIQ